MTLDQLNARLTAYLAAETAILTQNQEYLLKPGDGTERRVRRADLAEIRAEIKSLNAQIASLTPGRRTYYTAPTY